MRKLKKCVFCKHCIVVKFLMDNGYRCVKGKSWLYWMGLYHANYTVCDEFEKDNTKGITITWEEFYKKRKEGIYI